jgi:D-alanyl-D-alanine dipeptidase
MSQRRPSKSEPVSHLARVPIRECGERLVDYRGVSERIVIPPPVFQYTRAALARETVVSMLASAAEALPQGLALGVLEGWRPRHIQRRMFLTQTLRYRNLHPDWPNSRVMRAVHQVTAPPDGPAPPPHSTGGAVDVFLMTLDGERIDTWSPKKLFDPDTYAADAKGLSPEANRNRAILREAMSGAGFTNYPSEYWHWSYGDQGWAYRGGHSEAIYGPIDNPEGWSPAPEDDVDEPLVRLWGAGEGSGFPSVRDG